MTVQTARLDPSVVAVLRGVYDPCCRDKGISVVDMGLLYRASVERGVARVELLLTSGWCPFASSVLTQVKEAVQAMPDVDTADVEIVWDEAWSPDRLADSARQRLRFLPAPATVTDPAAYVTKNWPSSGTTREPTLEAADDR